MTHATVIDLLDSGIKGLPTTLSLEVSRLAHLAGKMTTLDPIYAKDRASVKRWLVNFGWRFSSNGIEPPGPFIKRQKTTRAFDKSVYEVFDKLWKEGDRSKPTTPDERLILACWMSKKLIEWRVTGRLP